MYQSVANGHSLDFYYEIKKRTKWKLILSLLWFKLGCSHSIGSAWRVFRILTNIFNGTRINLMVIGALGTKAKKIVKFFRKSPRPNICASLFLILPESQTNPEINLLTFCKNICTKLQVKYEKRWGN